MHSSSCHFIDPWFEFLFLWISFWSRWFFGYVAMIYDN